MTPRPQNASATGAGSGRSIDAGVGGSLLQPVFLGTHFRPIGGRRVAISVAKTEAMPGVPRKKSPRRLQILLLQPHVRFWRPKLRANALWPRRCPLLRQ